MTSFKVIGQLEAHPVAAGDMVVSKVQGLISKTCLCLCVALVAVKTHTNIQFTLCF